MANYYARLSGNINASIWATTPSGTAAAVTFASGDVLVSNSFAIAINVDTNLGSSGQLRNDTTGGATAGGTFTLAAGLTLTANVVQGNVTGGATVVTYAGATPNSASIVGNASSVNTSGGQITINHTGTGTLNFTGNITGDAHGASVGGVLSLANASGTINFTGNATGGSGILGYAIQNAAAGTINVVGNCLGGSAAAIGNQSTGTVNITGQAIGSATGGAGAGVANISTGTIVVTRAVGNGYGPGSVGLAAAVGVANSVLGVVSVEEIEYGTLGMSPTSGAGIRLKKITSNVAKFNYCDTAGSKTLVDATQGQMPAATDVRNGVSYASGALTGTCAVPDAGSVALGVPVDAGFGTAVLTPSAIRAELATELGRIDASVSSRLSPSGTLATVTNLTNAPASVTPTDIWSHSARTLTSASGPTATEIRQEMDSNSTQLSAIKLKTDNLPSDPADQSLVESAIAGIIAPSASTVAAAVRSELSTELARVDAAISSRLASSAYTAAPTTAQIATAVEGSLLNEADGQAVLNAIVGAIGNQNLSEVSLVAAVRADLERAGGKIDSIPTTAAPSASTVAGAVRTELGAELGRIDAAVSSRLASASYTAPTAAPTAAQNASAVRSELSTELARVDAAISTRLAGSAYTAPANSDVAAIKAKTDALNTERLANVATTAIVGNLIAQSNS